MISVALLFISAIALSNACVPTSTSSTTATPCCPMLSSSSLPRATPTNLGTYEQCSVLQRVSSTCPVDGIVVCDAAQETNPTGMQIEFLSSSGTVVRTFTASGSQLSAQVFCVNGQWRVRTTAGGTATAVIDRVTCSQTGSVGTDRGYVIGSAHQ
uniref:C6 domain-containing protein n=1 Tax=Caenorhabditis japonica TaxID=281687 RepID=A0A8R1DL88_CAEJA